MSPVFTKRMYRRILANYMGYCLTSHTFQTVMVRDISLNGYRIEGPLHLALNSIVTLQFWLPDGEGTVDIDQAVVRWRREREFGLQTISLSNAADFRVARHVEQRLRQSAVHAVLQHGLTRVRMANDGVRSRDRGCGTRSPGEA